MSPSKLSRTQTIAVSAGPSKFVELILGDVVALEVNVFLDEVAVDDVLLRRVFVLVPVRVIDVFETLVVVGSSRIFRIPKVSVGVH